MTESWLSALKSPELIFAVMLTAKTCLVAGAGFLVLAPPLAWLFARREGVGVRALSFFVTLPLVFPPVALGYLLLLLIGRSGPLGGLSGCLHRGTAARHSPNSGSACKRTAQSA